MDTVKNFNADHLWAPSDLLERSLSELPRKLLRNAIVSHPGWKAFSEMNNCSVSNMTKRGFLATAYTLGIDVPRVFENAEKQAAATEARMNDGRDYDERANSENGRDWAGAATSAPPPPAPVAPAPVPNELGAMLAALVGPYLNTVSADMETRLRDTLLASVKEKLADMQPVTRLEVKRHDGSEWKSTGRQHPKMADLLALLTMRQANGMPLNVWMTGPTGSGKTTAARQAAEALGLDFHFQGAAMQEHHVLGYESPVTGLYFSKPFRRAFEFGGVFLADEVDSWSNEALLCLNSALANGHCNFPDKAVQMHPDFICIGAGNTWGNGATAKYIGRLKIDLAVLSRFAKIHWPSDDLLEQDICGNVEWAKHVQKMRLKVQQIGLTDCNIDTRTSMQGAAMIAAGWSFEKAAEHTYLAGMADADRARLMA